MFGTHFFIRRFLALVMTLSVLPFQLPAKSKKQAAAESMRSAGLKFYILEGNDAVNFIPDRKAVTPVVEVRDDNGLPVEKVDVEFRLPDTGPGGQFENGKHVITVISNTSGQAQAPFTVSQQTGSFSIQVRATIDTRMASTLIFQSNSMKSGGDGTTTKSKGRPLYKSWKLWAVVGAAGTVTAILLLKGSGKTTVVLTPGGPTFGTPH